MKKRYKNSVKPTFYSCTKVLDDLIGWNTVKPTLHGVGVMTHCPHPIKELSRFLYKEAKS